MYDILEPPSYEPPCVVAGNYESDGDDEIACPICGKKSGWLIDLWLYNMPPEGLFCNRCGDTFYESDFIHS